MGPAWPVMRLMVCTRMSARRQADDRDAALTGESVRGIRGSVSHGRPPQAQRTRGANALFPGRRVAFFLPGIGVIVVPVALPETPAVLGHQFEAADPLRALPEV